MKFVKRADWGAPATSPATYIGATKGVKVHYLGTPYTSREHSGCDDQVRSIRAAHLRSPEGYSDIAYNALVCEHGYVFEGRGAHKKTGANGNQTLNAAHYAVCALLGSSGLTTPTDEMLHGLRDAIEWLREDGDAGNEIKGHRDGYATACPGDALYAWVKAGAKRPGSNPPTSGDGAAGGASTYTVVKGDTLTSIAKRCHTTVAKLTELNDLTDPDSIRVGQTLKLPPGKTPAPATVPPFPGRDAFRLGKSHPAVTALDRQLIRLGFTRHHDGDGYQVGPRFTEHTRLNVAAFQRSRKELAGDPDGYPGPLTWKLLHS